MVEIKEKSRKVQCITDALSAVVRRGIPPWIELEKEGYKGLIKSFPSVIKYLKEYKNIPLVYYACITIANLIKTSSFINDYFCYS